MIVVIVGSVYALRLRFVLLCEGFAPAVGIRPSSTSVPELHTFQIWIRISVY
jgi:hypothetical protein